MVEHFLHTKAEAGAINGFGHGSVALIVELGLIEGQVSKGSKTGRFRPELFTPHPKTFGFIHHYSFIIIHSSLFILRQPFQNAAGMQKAIRAIRGQKKSRASL